MFIYSFGIRPHASDGAMRTADDDDDDSQEIIKVREWIPHKGLILKVIPVKLFLNLEPSSPEDDTGATHGQPKRLSRNCLRHNGGKCSKTFHTTDVFCTPSRLLFSGLLFALCSFGCSLFYRSFGFTELKIKETITAKVKWLCTRAL